MMITVAVVRKRTAIVRTRKRKHLKGEEEEEEKRIIPSYLDYRVFCPFRSMWQHCINLG